MQTRCGVITIEMSGFRRHPRPQYFMPQRENLLHGDAADIDFRFRHMIWINAKCAKYTNEIGITVSYQAKAEHENQELIKPQKSAENAKYRKGHNYEETATCKKCTKIHSQVVRH